MCYRAQMGGKPRPGRGTFSRALPYPIRRGAMQLDLHAIPSWLDEETSALVRDKIKLLAERHPDVLAIILYGSVARHEERSLDEPDPSDVDLLVVLDGDRAVVRSQGLALFQTM